MLEMDNILDILFKITNLLLSMLFKFRESKAIISDHSILNILSMVSIILELKNCLILKNQERI